MTTIDDTASHGHRGNEGNRGDDATWYGALLRRARGVHVMIASYLISAALCVKYFRRDFQSLYMDLPIVFWLVILGPIVFIIIFDATPRLISLVRRRQREEIALHTVDNTSSAPYFRLDPYVPDNPDNFQRLDGIHEQVLIWLSSSAKPLMFLSGMSGAGKSSVLQGYVLPKLRNTGWTVEELTISSTLSTQFRECLDRACPKGQTLVVLDQFEEFVILQSDSGARERSAFLKSVSEFRSRKPANVTVLFAFRTDYQSEVEALEFDEFISRKTWMEIGLFSRTAARKFLENSPQKPPEKLVDRILDGADNLDDTPSLYRPITLNMLGLALLRSDRALTTRPEALVQSYMAAAISEPSIRDIAPGIVRQLITRQGTRWPRSATAIAEACKARRADVIACLNRLAAAGLARRLGDNSSTWELSHDFVARQFSILVQRLDPHRFARLVTAVAVAVFVCLTCFAIYMLPTYARNLAISTLRRSGASFYETGDSSQVAVSQTKRLTPESLAYISYCLRYLKVDELSVYGDANFIGAFLSKLQVVPGLKGITLNAPTPTTQRIDLSRIEIEHQLSHLQFTNIDSNAWSVIGTIGSLQSVSITRSNVSDVSWTNKMKLLKFIELYDDPGLTDFRPIFNDNLEVLSVTGNSQLHSIDQIVRDPGALEALSIADDVKVTSITQLARAHNLLSLNLSSTSVTDLRPISGLPHLTMIDLVDTPVKDFTPLATLPSLKTVTIEASKASQLPVSVASRVRYMQTF